MCFLLLRLVLQAIVVFVEAVLRYGLSKGETHYIACVPPRSTNRPDPNKHSRRCTFFASLLKMPATLRYALQPKPKQYAKLRDLLHSVYKKEGVEDGTEQEGGGTAGKQYFPCVCTRSAFVLVLLRCAAKDFLLIFREEKESGV